MTEEIYLKLNKFVKPLNCAYRASYARIAPGDLKELLEIYYGPEWQSKVSKTVMTCGHCKLTELKKIGADYFNYEHTRGA